MRTKRGIVISAKGNKTAVILVHTSKMHPVLGKAYRVSKKFHAHDEDNNCKEGDEIIISETRPVSKMKKWKVDKILKKGGILAEIDKEVILGDVQKDNKLKEENANQDTLKEELDNDSKIEKSNLKETK